MNIPKNEDYPADVVQCDGCGGNGCKICNDNGWLLHGHLNGRKCYREVCLNPIPPAQVAVYCSNKCATEDA